MTLDSSTAASNSSLKFVWSAGGPGCRVQSRPQSWTGILDGSCCTNQCFLPVHFKFRSYEREMTGSSKSHTKCCLLSKLVQTHLCWRAGSCSDVSGFVEDVAVPTAGRGLVAHVRCVTTPQWGAADAEIKVLSGENTELKRSPFKAWSRSDYSRTCCAYCKGFLLCLFLPFRSIHLHFFPNLSLIFFPVLSVANTGPYEGPHNKIGHPAGCRFPCWVPTKYK